MMLFKTPLSSDDYLRHFAVRSTDTNIAPMSVLPLMHYVLVAYISPRTQDISVLSFRLELIVCY